MKYMVWEGKESNNYMPTFNWVCENQPITWGILTQPRLEKQISLKLKI